MKKALTLAVLLIFVASFGVVRAQESKLPSFVTDSLDNYIKRGLASWNIPGLSVAIVKDGKVVFMKGYGVTRIGGAEPVDENTLFMIGSNTKAFTATALTILQASGKMNMTDKVRKWMPEFRLRDSLASNDVMICDLLSHRLGFETFQGDFTYWNSNLSRAEVIQKMSLIRTPYHFRTQWGYCNAAFLTAGELIPRITGRTWDDVVRDSILVPLKMSRTFTAIDEAKKITNLALPHSVINRKMQEISFDNLSNLAPAGSIVSSAKDMSSWIMVHLDNGKLNGAQVISPKAIQAIRKPYSIMAIDPRDKRATHFYLYGLGLLVNDCNGRLVYSHTGGIDGFLSSVMFIPEEKVGIVVLTNTDQNSFYQDLTSEIRDAFLGLPYKGYSDKSLVQFNEDKKLSDARIDSLRNVVKQGNMPKLPLKSFVGRYTNEVYGDISVNLDKGKLNITFSHHPNLVANLEYMKDDTFLCSYSLPTFGIVEMPFKVAVAKVEGLTLRVNEFVEATPYEFSKENEVNVLR
jgi:CubicO group peptidase (beta-lactamase class C family)